MSATDISDLHALIMMSWPVLLASIFAVLGYLAHELRSLRISLTEVQINQGWIMLHQGIPTPSDAQRTMLLNRK